MKSAAELDERWVRNHAAQQLRTWLKERAVAYLGGSCRCCGYDRCLAALDFHHPGKKDFNISSKMSWSAIEPELKHVILLCSNCHRETHAGYHPQLLGDSESEMADVFELLSASSAG